MTYVNLTAILLNNTSAKLELRDTISEQSVVKYQVIDSRITLEMIAWYLKKYYMYSVTDHGDSLEIRSDVYQRSVYRSDVYQRSVHQEIITHRDVHKMLKVFENYNIVMSNFQTR